MTLRKLLGSEMGRMTPEEYSKAPESGMVAVLDNVRSAHNVGSVFRSCDAFHADAVFLCGICAVPPSAEIHKTALGAELTLPYEYVDSTMEAARSLRAKGYILVAVEQTQGSVSLEKFTPEPSGRYAFIFGNEVSGVSQEVVDFCDMALEIPQRGCKHSLNVSVAAGVVLWHCFSKKNL